MLAPLVEREILWRLLTGPFGDVIRQIGLPDSNLSHVNRAIGWIRDNYAERMRISDPARPSRLRVGSSLRYRWKNRATSSMASSASSSAPK